MYVNLFMLSTIIRFQFLLLLCLGLKPLFSQEKLNKLLLNTPDYIKKIVKMKEKLNIWKSILIFWMKDEK